MFIYLSVSLTHTFCNGAPTDTAPPPPSKKAVGVLIYFHLCPHD